MSRSIFVRFAIIFLAALIPLLVLAGLTLNTAPPAPTVEARRLALELDRLLDIRVRETFTLAALPSVRAFAASDVSERTGRAAVALNELQAWVAADKSVREAFILDRAGLVILSTGKDWRQDWSVRAFVKQALAGQLDISPPSRDQGEYSLYYAAPVLDNRGQIAGALVARVDAQELWAPVNAASTREAYAVLVDGDGVRLVDGGDPTRTLTALAPLTVAQDRRVIDDQTYGAEIKAVRADNFKRAADMLASGNPELIGPADLQVEALSAQPLTLKPWTVLFIAPAPSLARVLENLLWPAMAALFCAGVAALILRT